MNVCIIVGSFVNTADNLHQFDNQHWVGCAIVGSQVFLYDPLGLKRNLSRAENFFNRELRFLFDDVDSGVIFIYSPKQKDSCSCGIYVMMWMHSLLRKTGTDFLMPRYIPFFRLLIMNDLLKNKPKQ